MSVIRPTRRRLPIVCCPGRWSLFAALIAIPLNCWGQADSPSVTLQVRTGPTASARLSEERPPASVVPRDKVALVVAPPSAPADDSTKGVKSAAKPAPAKAPAEDAGTDVKPAAAKATPAADAPLKEAPPLKEIAEQPQPTKAVPLAETQRTSPKPSPTATTSAESRPSSPKPNPTAVAASESPPVSARLTPVETIRLRDPVASTKPTPDADSPTASVARWERIALVVSAPLPPRESPEAAVKPAEFTAPPTAYTRRNEVPKDPQPRAMELIAVESAPAHANPKPVGMPVGMVALQGPPPMPQPIERIPEERPPLSPQPYVVEMAPVESPPLAEGPVPAPCPLCYRTRCGVYCNGDDRGQHLTWRAMYPIPWEAFAQGEYVGPARLAHVPEYRLRVDDVMDFVYIFSLKVSSRPYRLGVGDAIRITSLTAESTVDDPFGGGTQAGVVRPGVVVQPDGMITLRLIGRIRAAGLTLEELRQTLEQGYEQYLRKPSITVLPIQLNSALRELREAVLRTYSPTGGQGIQVRVTPEGTVQLPLIGSVPVQGLTMAEVKREIEARYEAVAEGIEVTPILTARAPRYFFIVGEVRLPGRFTMEGPTTVLQAIAMAGSWNVGAHLEHVVVLRRDENWCLMATKLNLRPQLFGHKPCNGDEIWLRDSDIVIVPKSPLLEADDFIDLVFTRGIYRVFPMSVSLNFAKLSTL